MVRKVPSRDLRWTTSLARLHLARRAVGAVLLTTMGAASVTFGSAGISLAQPAPAAPPASGAPAAPSATPSAAPASPSSLPSASPSSPPSTSPPAPPSGSAQPPAEGPNPQLKEEARSHFEKGLKLLDDGAYSAALAEFLVSLDQFPTRNATLNAAFALRKLNRFDESLDMYERFLRNFQNIPADDKTLAQRAVAELRALVGTIDIEGAEPGALISISGIARGEFPPVAPLRVAAGSQLVRVFKEGYEPYETRVEVAGGQLVRVAAKMQALKASGRLKVSETAGRAVDVVVDNSVVGPAPWEGVLAVGPHMVMLRGQGKLGTQPVSTEVKSGQTTTLAVKAEELDGAIRIVTTPPGAVIALDSVTVTSGNWSGRVRSGSHKVEVTAPGFLKETRDVKVEPGGVAVVEAKLERDEDAPQWQKPSKIFVDASVGFALGPTLGGGVAESCTGGCTGGTALGPLAKIHAAYERGSGFGLGLTLGYLAVWQDVTNRQAFIQPAVSEAQVPGQGTDRLRLTGYAVGAHLSIRYGEKIPFLARASGGVVIANVRDDRSGTFQPAGGESVTIDTVTYAQDALYAFANPEVRLGYKFTDNFEASLGLQAFLLIATQQPAWGQKLDKPIELDAKSVGIATYPQDTLTGSVVFLLVPGISARYDF